VNDNMQLT